MLILRLGCSRLVNLDYNKYLNFLDLELVIMVTELLRRRRVSQVCVVHIFYRAMTTHQAHNAEST